MTFAVVVLGIAAAILLFLVVLQKREINSISEQLAKMKEQDTNNLVNSSNGTADRLINEINCLLKELRANRVDYSRKNHAMEQMMTNISHDLRTPLTSAMGYINLLRSSQLSEEEKDRELVIIEQRLARLEELINSFFEFSKVISGGERPELSEVDLVAVLEESIVHYFDDYEDRGRSISLDCPFRRVMLSTNRHMLLRIFDNLIGNALKHGTGNLAVTVSKGDELMVSFQNMTEIEDVDVEHIFDEFYTTDISRTKGNTGLGLAIAKQFTEMLGGSIFAQCTGGSFTVTVRLK